MSKITDFYTHKMGKRVGKRGQEHFAPQSDATQLER